MRSKSGAVSPLSPATIAAHKYIITYSRVDSTGTIVRSFPPGTRRKPPTLRARVYDQGGTVQSTFTD